MWHNKRTVHLQGAKALKRAVRDLADRLAKAFIDALNAENGLCGVGESLRQPGADKSDQVVIPDVELLKGIQSS